MRCHSAPLLLTTAIAVVSCGSSAAAGGQPVAPSGTPTATATASPAPCAATSPSVHLPVGAMQALSVISIRVVPDVPVSAGVMKLGMVSCVTVGVGQLVSIDISARVPPLPRETHAAAQLLTGVTLSPAAPPPAAVAQAGKYTVTFTARGAGTTALTYLPATCTLPPGVC